MWVSSKEDWFEIKDGLPLMAGAPKWPKELFK